jgi:hypothetical protein
MPTHRIKLTRYGVENIQWTHYGAFRMRVEASDAEGPDLDKYVFVYEYHPPDPLTGQSCSQFAAVAGPAQMSQIPVGEPDERLSYPFFRLDYVEQDFTSEQEALRVWGVIKDEVCILCDGMTRYRELAELETFWCPSEPDDVGSTSESASESASASESS